MNVLVTGGAGFIGRNLVERLVALTNCVTVLDDLSNAHNRDNPVPPGALFINGNVKGFGDVAAYDVIYHLACRNILQCVAAPQTDLAVNAGGTLSLLSALAECGRSVKLVYASSVSVKTLASEYAISKAAGEHYVHLFRERNHVHADIIRYSNVYGPYQRDGVVMKMIDSVIAGQQIRIYGDGQQTRDFTYVGDVVSNTIAAGIFKSAVPDIPHESGTATATTINKLARLVNAAAVANGLQPAAIAHLPERAIDNVRYRIASPSFPTHTLVPLDKGVALTFAWRLGNRGLRGDRANAVE